MTRCFCQHWVRGTAVSACRSDQRCAWHCPHPKPVAEDATRAPSVVWPLGRAFQCLSCRVLRLPFLLFLSCRQLVENKAGILFLSESSMIRKWIVNKQKQLQTAIQVLLEKQQCACYSQSVFSDFYGFPSIAGSVIFSIHYCQRTSYFYYIGPFRTFNLYNLHLICFVLLSIW